MIIAQTGRNIGRHNTPSMAAALAYHAIISLAPLMLFSIAVASQIFGAQASAGQIVSGIEDIVGREVAMAIEAVILSNSRQVSESIATALVTAAVAFYAASNIFRQLISALNVIWGVHQQPNRSLLNQAFTWIRKQLLAFIMVLSMGLLLLSMLIISTMAVHFADLLRWLIPGITGFLILINFVALPLALTAFCLLVFKIFPEVPVAWRNVWPGALITAVCLTIGEGLIGLYLSHNIIATFYGAAGSVIVLLLWVYLSAIILLYGAEFTHTYATFQPRASRMTSNLDKQGGNSGGTTPRAPRSS